MGGSKEGYNSLVEDFRDREYPMLKGATYLDHAGTTLYAKSLIERFSTDMVSNLYGNPHSASAAAQHAAHRVEEARLRLLALFNANPDDFDVVFVANATAGIKLVMECFREEGFFFGYHRDSHTSLVGVREAATESRCFESDAEVETWLRSDVRSKSLLAYPAQSNMDGRRLPLEWCAAARTSPHIYTLVDAAALVSTSPLDLRNAHDAPDFTVLSLYKIFGFPDLGALIVNRRAGNALRRRYFGGGTVDMVVCVKEQWHVPKEVLHERLEDGTLPVHSIMALHAALDVHSELFGSLGRISRHCASLARQLYEGLAALRHGNGARVCEIFKDASSDYLNPSTQGPVLAFNLRNSQGAPVPNSEVEKLASVRNIHLRTGGVCNPGGIASRLGLAPWEMKRNFSAGLRCGAEGDVMHGKATGIVRASLGAMSTRADVCALLSFLQEFFVEPAAPVAPPSPASDAARYYIESLTVYPLKSCAAYKIPPSTPWPIHAHGLAWDREWCLVRPGSNAALSQKRYPRMALLVPTLDLSAGVLVISCSDANLALDPISVPLSLDPALFLPSTTAGRQTRVCGEDVEAVIYANPALATFFAKVLGFEARLARFPPGAGARYAKTDVTARGARGKRATELSMPGAFPEETGSAPMPMLLANESPILLISRSSVNRLNEEIKNAGGRAVRASAFRANVVVAEREGGGGEEAYAEDRWSGVRLGKDAVPDGVCGSEDGGEERGAFLDAE
ncbi:PLP-dependent transferase [Trichodelitschia bisporula]|uniref:Molybdenum cofactor sulfurase n=1 Tax=Trichodelitschia bisporula TaxID=703511 RepID=A0A6G1IBB6_9PEZI|nr:PLP-dependent transferase [Trichodelitschia bisporula]